MVADRQDEHAGQVVGLAAALKADGNRVTVHRSEKKGDELTRALLGAWARDRPEVVHAHSWTVGPAVAAAATRRDVPFVHSFHALGDGMPERVEIEDAVSRSASQVTTVGNSEVEALVRRGIRRRNVSMVPD